MKDLTITDKDYADFKQMVKDSNFKYDRTSEKRLEELKKIAKLEGYYEDAKEEFEALEKKFAHNLDREMDRRKEDICRLRKSSNAITIRRAKWKMPSETMKTSRLPCECSTMKANTKKY